MIGYLFLGLILFMMNRTTLMFASLGCCAALCIHLKSASNQHLMFPTPAEEAPKVTCAMINLSLSDDLELTRKSIHNTMADVILFQEYTPDWDNFLQTELSATYPYRALMTRIDPFGMAWYSRHPIMLSDTFSAADIPNLLVNVALQNNVFVNFISVHTRVPSDAMAYRHIRRHFNEVSMHLDALKDPLIVAGDLNLPSWTNEVMEFKLQSKLTDSRRDIVPASIQGSVSFFKVPVDHILYSADLECTAFHEVLGSKESHLGIVGNYQLVGDEILPE
jgi:endonuclease/exonuclease/phosphatase (EEP) superfamily protein YafD